MKQEKESGLHKEDYRSLPLTKNNFIAIAVAGLLIVVGFILMLGGGSTPEEFNPEIFSTRRIVVGPCLSFIGFVGMAVAIIWRPSDKNHNE